LPIIGVRSEPALTQCTGAAKAPGVFSGNIRKKAARESS
jgi:hypothetical protein